MQRAADRVGLPLFDFIFYALFFTHHEHIFICIQNKFVR